MDSLRGMRKEAQWALFRRLVELQIYVLHAWHSSISSLIIFYITEDKSSSWKGKSIAIRAYEHV